MRFIFCLAFILSSVVATFVLVAALDHNTMEVFCKVSSASECDFDVSYAAFIWILWFLPAFVVSSVLFLGVRSVYRFINR